MTDQKCVLQSTQDPAITMHPSVVYCTMTPWGRWGFGATFEVNFSNIPTSNDTWRFVYPGSANLAVESVAVDNVFRPLLRDDMDLTDCTIVVGNIQPCSVSDDTLSSGCSLRVTLKVHLPPSYARCCLLYLPFGTEDVAVACYIRINTVYIRAMWSTCHTGIRSHTHRNLHLTPTETPNGYAIFPKISLSMRHNRRVYVESSDLIFSMGSLPPLVVCHPRLQGQLVTMSAPDDRYIDAHAIASVAWRAREYNRPADDAIGMRVAICNGHTGMFRTEIMPAEQEMAFLTIAQRIFQLRQSAIVHPAPLWGTGTVMHTTPAVLSLTRQQTGCLPYIVLDLVQPSLTWNLAPLGALFVDSVLRGAGVDGLDTPGPEESKAELRRQYTCAYPPVGVIRTAPERQLSRLISI